MSSGVIYEGRLKISWTHFITESGLCGGAVMVSFWSTSIGKWCNFYDAPPTSQKRATHHLPQASGG